MRFADGLRAVAVFEAAKGTVVLLAGFGLLSLMDRDLESFVEQLVAHLHLNPAKGYPRIFLDAAANITNTRLWWLAAFALLYAAIRWIEAYGLWLEKRWAEGFAVISGALYVPAELYELAHGANALKFMLLAINLCIVAYMIRALRRTRHDRGSARDPEAGV
ncbi:MAG: DUF2127 domain-containing protein [Burkholderiales bacterium]